MQLFQEFFPQDPFYEDDTSAERLDINKGDRLSFSTMVHAYPKIRKRYETIPEFINRNNILKEDIILISSIVTEFGHRGYDLFYYSEQSFEKLKIKLTS